MILQDNHDLVDQDRAVVFAGPLLNSKNGLPVVHAMPSCQPTIFSISA